MKMHPLRGLPKSIDSDSAIFYEIAIEKDKRRAGNASKNDILFADTPACMPEALPIRHAPKKDLALAGV
jgi:hypothetical protein